MPRVSPVALATTAAPEGSEANEIFTFASRLGSPGGGRRLCGPGRGSGLRRSLSGTFLRPLVDDERGGPSRDSHRRDQTDDQPLARAGNLDLVVLYFPGVPEGGGHGPVFHVPGLAVRPPQRQAAAHVAGLDRGQPGRAGRARTTREPFRIQHGGAELLHGAEPVIARFGQRAQHDGLLGQGNGRVDVARGGRRHGQVLDDDLAVAFAAERDLAGQHLEQDHAQRVDVGAVVDVDLPLALLGGHVVGRPHHRAGARLVRDLLFALGQLGQAEVQHLDEVLRPDPRVMRKMFSGLRSR